MKTNVSFPGTERIGLCLASTRQEAAVFLDQNQNKIIQVKLKSSKKKQTTKTNMAVHRTTPTVTNQSPHFTMLISHIWFRSEKPHNHSNLTSQEPS